MAAKGRAGRVDEKNDLRPKENHGYHTKYKGWESYFGLPAVKKTGYQAGHPVSFDSFIPLCLSPDILQVKHSFFDLLCSSLIPELCSDVSAGTSCNVELALVTVSAMRAFPYELSVILDDLDLAVVAAYLTVIALRI